MQDSTLINAFTEALKVLLQDKCIPPVVRAIETNAKSSDQDLLWQTIENSGFADALRGEANGGAALSLSDAFPLLMLCGQYALPVPLAETIVARAWLDNQTTVVPTGSITLAMGTISDTGELSCHNVTSGRVADWVLVGVQSSENFTLLLPRDQATQSSAAFPLDANLTWPKRISPNSPYLPAIDIRCHQAYIYASQLAGALMTIFDRTLQFANDRQQFGKPIGKFQAIQHQLSVMAEHVFAARMAAQIGSHSADATPELHRVAVAKARTSEAALEVAALSHSIHGAIGFTAEFDLHLFTRRLHLWRQAAGSESYWHKVLGHALVSGQGQGMALDLIRNITDIH
jgi:acyl-CoA dehydrogenase